MGVGRLPRSRRHHHDRRRVALRVGRRRSGRACARRRLRQRKYGPCRGTPFRKRHGRRLRRRAGQPRARPLRDRGARGHFVEGDAEHLPSRTTASTSCFDVRVDVRPERRACRRRARSRLSSRWADRMANWTPKARSASCFALRASTSRRRPDCARPWNGEPRSGSANCSPMPVSELRATQRDFVFRYRRPSTGSSTGVPTTGRR